MLDQGFERDIRAIVAQTHSARQTALFSATWPDNVRELAHSFLQRPIKVTIGSDDLAAGTRITQIVEVCYFSLLYFFGTYYFCDKYFLTHHVSENGALEH